MTTASPVQIIDANLEGFSSLLLEEGEAYKRERRVGENDRAIPENIMNNWTNRSFLHLESNVAALTSRETYKNIDRYKTRGD